VKDFSLYGFIHFSFYNFSFLHSIEIEMWDAIPERLYTVIVCLVEILPADIKPLGDSVLIQILFCALYTKLLECASTEDVDNDVPIVVNEGDPNAVVRSRKTICQVLAECICAIDEENKHTELLAALVNQSVESQKRSDLSERDDTKDDLEAQSTHTHEARSDEEYDVENADYISEVLASDVLTTSVGKQSVKMMYKYIKYNVEFLLQQLNVSDVEPGEL
jgi:protein KIAA0825